MHESRMLQAEIEKHVRPEDLIGLSDENLVYVAKCTAEAIRRVRALADGTAEGAAIDRNFRDRLAESNELETLGDMAARAGNHGAAFRLYMRSFDKALESAGARI